LKKLTPSSPDIKNPFGAPVFYKDEVTSTMDEARAIDGQGDGEYGAAHGTVIAAGYQSAGRGRSGRPWQMNRGESLPFTVILKYPSVEQMPACLTLRTGLAVARGITSFFFRGCHSAFLKWPNDVIMIDVDGRGKKVAGILTEARFTPGNQNGSVYIGIGVNLAQTKFPPELAGKAISIALALQATDRTMLKKRRFVLVEKILTALYEELNSGDGWRERLKDWLYMCGQKVKFIPGPPQEDGKEGEVVEGILEGIGPGGEIVLTVDGARRSFITGELKVY
jgi:BirA family biotin operon repressor/biotin-[acetyl-CoA-carboxylase] ligase